MFKQGEELWQQNFLVEHGSYFVVKDSGTLRIILSLRAIVHRRAASIFGLMDRRKSLNSSIFRMVRMKIEQ